MFLSRLSSVACFVTLLSGVFVYVPTASAEPIGLIERFALAKDREAVLAELIPGTEDHYFYHCLHYQVSGQLEKAEALLAQWKLDDAARNSEYLQRIEDRQRLLSYSSSPDRTVDYLRMRLGVQLDHRAPATPGVRRYPSRLDQALIAADRWITPIEIANNQLTRAGIRHLAKRVADQGMNDFAMLRHILQQVDGPWIDGLATLVIAELKLRRPAERTFGEFPAHRFLTLEQLRRVAAEVPEVASASAVVAEVLMRLRPGDDADMSQQPEVRGEYLRRVDEYASTLPEAFNGLKAATLYQIMQSELAAGKPNPETLIRYLRLPRLSPIAPAQPVPPATGRIAPGPAVDLSADYTELALVPRIGNEEPLVRTLLEIFLKDSESTAAFDGLLRPEYVQQVFAESKLLGGVGPADRWYAMLPSGRAQPLRDRVELTLAPENPPRHDPAGETSLKVDIKNVDSLVVRIYQINTESYYRTRDQLVDTDIDLDALVPTIERQIAYSQDAVRRHRETLSLDEIQGRGVWIVDLLGGGLRARALIRRGDLRAVITQSADGMRVIALDENRRGVPFAKLVVTGRELVADKDGMLTLPASDVDTHRKVILRDEQLAVPVRFAQPAESYELTAAMFIDRQQVRSGQMADLVVRPRLMMSGHPVDIGMLKNVAIQLVATDLDGISTSRRFSDLSVTPSEDVAVAFRVPPRVASISATLSATVDSIAKNQVNEVRAGQTWDFAAIRRSSTTGDAHLTRDGDDWVIEALGLSGEKLVAATMTIALTSHLRNTPLEVTLQSDDAGRIVLGRLETVRSLSVTFGGLKRNYELSLTDGVWPSSIHGVVGQDLRLPIPTPSDVVDGRFKLFSIRNGRPETDRSAAVGIAGGLLAINGLQAGDYQLLDRETDAPIVISVTDGPVAGRFAIGEVRNLELPAGQAIGIDSIDPVEGGLAVRIAGAGPLTRVHVIAGRYHTDTDPFRDLGLPYPSLARQPVWNPTSGYLSDLRLGDEYRYVMRRRYAAKYPGVMLPQPGLILNPWETEATENLAQAVAEGDALPPAASEMMRKADSDRASGMARIEVGGSTADYDFLADKAVVLTNLVPDADGVVVVPSEAIDSLAIVQIVATDPLSIVRRTIYSPLTDLPVRDLRLAAAIPAQRDFAFVRGVVGASADKPLDLKTLGSAQLQVYSSVGDLLDLYLTIVGDERLGEFRQIGRWHTLEPRAKESLYGRLACHELHLFLSVHDPDFFNTVIRPYLQNKKEKQFVDHYLLNNDLSPWNQPWKYAELNAAERALLARRVPEVREAILRQFRELEAIAPEDAALRRRLIDAALAGRGMEEQENLLAELLGRDKAEDAVWLSMGMPGMGGGGGGMGGGAMGGMGGTMGGMGGMTGEAMPESAEAMDGAVPMEPRNRRLREAEKRAAGRMFDDRDTDSPMPFFEQLDSTKQWAESHWDRVRVTDSGPDLIAVDPFWLDVASATDSSAMPSEHLLRPSGNRHAAIVALAFCGLPLSGDDVKLPADEAPFAPPHAVAVITKRLSELRPEADEPSQSGSILVGQRFERVIPDGRPVPRAKAVAVAPDEFLVGAPYRGQIILTNPTPTERTIDVLWQIPAGSVAIAGGQATDSRTITLAPFLVEKIDYEFYFPLPGDFVHYPVCVATDGVVAARAVERVFNVLAVPSRVDEKSWQSIAESGTAAQIDTFLQTANLRETDWNLVLHRLTDREIYEVISKVFDENKLENELVRGYSLHHRDPQGIKEFLSTRENLVGSVGPVLRSDLLTVDPIERRLHEHLEYAPLVVARIHPLREQNEILNPTFLDHYRDVMRVIAYSGEPNDTQRLVLVYHFLLQNRIEEAIEAFATVDAEKIETRLQYSYLAACLALHRGDLATAEKIAFDSSGHPVPRWKARFETLAEQLRQHRRWGGEAGQIKGSEGEAVRGDSGDLALIDRERRGGQAAENEPSVEVSIDGRTVRIAHRNAATAVLNLYAVDPELLFSKTPFVRDDLAGMAMVQATRTQTVELSGVAESKGNRGVTTVLLDENLARQTLMVEIVAGPARATTLYYGGNLAAYVSEGFGQVQVTDMTTAAAVSTAYVKVYARHQDGQIKFYKDGYTDLRGRFDYASISTGDLATVERFAILVIDPERGATIREANRP